jgi:hypothetical protein
MAVKDLINNVCSYYRGVIDGFEEPYDFGCGMTYESDDRNEKYDRGVNFGQWIGRVWCEIKRGPVYVE